LEKIYSIKHSQKNYSECVTLCDEILTIMEMNLEWMFKKATCLEKEKKYEAAITELNQILFLSPRNDEATKKFAEIKSTMIASAQEKTKKKDMETINSKIRENNVNSSPSTRKEKYLGECGICLDREVNVVIDPCGHFVCEDCTIQAKLQQCPVCRKGISKWLRVYA